MGTILEPTGNIVQGLLREQWMRDRRKQLTREERAITLMIAKRVQYGHSLALISRTSGVSLPRLVALARQAKIRYKHQRAHPQQIESAVRAVVEEGQTFRASAARHGMSKTAVHRFVQKRRNKAIDSAGNLIIAKRKWRCPVHGWVMVHPCVACAASGNA